MLPSIALYIGFGILPSLIWLFYYLAKDLHPEPKRMILKVFFWGAVVTIPTFFIQLGLAQLLKDLSLPFYLHSIVKWFFVIALTEELLKYVVVKLNVFNSAALDEPLDIMLYMVVAALGFAAAENLLYLFSPISNAVSLPTLLKGTIVIGFIRFIGATFLHTLASALFGYFLALGSVRNGARILYTVAGLSLATLLHGLYDFSIMTLVTPLNFLLPLAIIIGLTLFMLYDFNEIKKVKSICKI